MEYQRKLLEELMGPMDATQAKSYKDAGVCKHFLVDFCPHELFVNTKSDLVHDERLKIQYQGCPDKLRLGYEQKFLRYLETLIAELERRMSRQRERLIQDQNETGQREREAKASALREKIEDVLKKIDDYSEEGKIDEAQELSVDAEKLQLELRDLMPPEQGNKNEKRMELCNVCGVFLVINDASQRAEAHMEGKQHIGYQKIRDTIAQLRQMLAGANGSVNPATRGAMGGHDNYRGGSRRDDRYRRRDHEQNHRSERVQDRDRDRRRRSHSRSRSREHQRDRHRDRDRTGGDKRRDRSRSRERRRSRSRSLRREREERRDKRETVPYREITQSTTETGLSVAGPTSTTIDNVRTESHQLCRSVDSFGALGRHNHSENGKLQSNLTKRSGIYPTKESTTDRSGYILDEREPGQIG